MDETPPTGPAGPQHAHPHGHRHGDGCDCGHHNWHGHGYGRFPVWGLFLLFLGVGWLGGEMGWWDFRWSLAGPVAIIIVGLGMLLAWSRGRK